MTYKKIALKLVGFNCSPGRNKKVASYIGIYFLIALLIPSGFSLASELVFESKIEPISYRDTNGNPIVVPVKGKVTVLLLFNVNSISHQKLAAEFNFIFVNMVDQDKKVDLVYISKGETGVFKSLIDRYNIKFHFINDVDEKFFPFFDFKCGECIKIVIIDKESKLRYNASYIDFYFVNKIVDRYEKGDKENVHE